ncbi:MAG: hypothetical protein ACXVHJ_37740 [Solirubrobacteraceae bacterium]
MTGEGRTPSPGDWYREQCIKAMEDAALGRTPSPDQTECDFGRHLACTGYTQDESDPESCMCACHDEVNL